MRTNKWIVAIDQNTEKFLSAFGKLTEADLNWKPDEETWSIAQNIDHLIIINSSYFPSIKSLHDGNYNVPITGKVNLLVRLFGRILLKAVMPNSKRKVKTFAIWEPAESQVPSNILDRFKSHHEDLKQTITDSEPLLEKGAVISSPANKYIVYKLETAYDILITHEHRHYQQAKDVLQRLKSKSNDNY